ncbi:triose-phosphate isomerase [archaeon]|nr:triose-phosphate isomerase [archaeon]
MEYLFVNFKTYEEATGSKALSLGKLLASFFDGSLEIIPVVQATDLREVASSISLNVFAQHVDPVSFGSNTGKITPEAIKNTNAVGTIINHAEFKVDNDSIQKAVEACKKLGLKIMVCAENLERAKEVAFFNPDFIAVEPPELIGGDISVSSSNPELISDSVKAIHEINENIIVITGAGVKTSQDVSKALELGTQGVFVASGIVKADERERTIKELLSGFK